MISFLKKYKAIAIGFVVVLVVLIFLEIEGILKIPPFQESFIEIIIIFLFWWIIASFLIYRLPYVFKQKKAIIATAFLILFSVTILVVDNHFNIPDNPMTMTLLAVFWNFVFYILDPTFYKKYKRIIIGGYSVLLAYFLYIRLFTDYFQEEHTILFSIALLTFPIVIILWFFEQWKGLKKLKQEKSDAELKLLKSQINPHFFFNTLNNLYGLSIEKSDEAPKMILKLSDMMRYTIYEGKEDFVNLKDEITYLENYIELHKIRYHQHVDIRFEYEKGTDCKVAPLLFIVLLENAFKHGVERLTENAFVHLNVKVENEMIRFEIENNFDLPKIKTARGIGLNNLEKRLSLIYPKKHSLEISESENTYKVILEIDSK